MLLEGDLSDDNDISAVCSTDTSENVNSGKTENPPTSSPSTQQTQTQTQKPEQKHTHTMHLDESAWGLKLSEWKANNEHGHTAHFSASGADQGAESQFYPFLRGNTARDDDHSRRLRRLRKELSLVADSPHVSFSFPFPQTHTHFPQDPGPDRIVLMLTLEGPPASPYARGLFHIHVTLPPTWPRHPPRMRFLTPIYHPNVDEQGNVCVAFLHGDWCPALTLEKVTYMLCAILSDPDGDEGDRVEWELEARSWTGACAGVVQEGLLDGVDFG